MNKDKKYYGYEHYVGGGYSHMNVFYIGYGLKMRPTDETGRNQFWNYLTSKREYKVKIYGPFTKLEGQEWEIRRIDESGRLNDKTGILTNLIYGGDNQNKIGLIDKLDFDWMYETIDRIFINNTPREYVMRLDELKNISKNELLDFVMCYGNVMASSPSYFNLLMLIHSGRITTIEEVDVLYDKYNSRRDRDYNVLRTLIIHNAALRNNKLKQRK